MHFYEKLSYLYFFGSINIWSGLLNNNYPPGSNSVALQQGVHLIRLYFIRIWWVRRLFFVFWWLVGGGGWGTTFWFFKSLDIYLVYTLYVAIVIYAEKILVGLKV